jgi:hypothetical protein
MRTKSLALVAFLSACSTDETPPASSSSETVEVRSHMHVVLSDDSIVGHVRALDVAAGAVVSVPASQ